MIFLDNHSTTKIDQEVLDVMLPYFLEKYGNSSSPHFFGEDARDAVRKAKEEIALLIGCDANSIFFTSSATEANNVALKGRVLKHLLSNDSKITIITTDTEHSSIMSCIGVMCYNPNINIKILNVDCLGVLDYDKLECYLSECEKPIIVSIMAANNEIGTVHDLDYVGRLCKKYGALFHTDATQAIGKVDINVNDLNIFALTMNAHKIHGPKGIGALYLRDVDLFSPIIDGGYQSTISSGTQNVPAIVGFGKAVSICNSKQNKDDIYNIEVLRNYLLFKLKDSFSDLIINGTMVNRLPNNLNFSIPGVRTDIVLSSLDDIAVSGGSACMSGKVVGKSHVIDAIKCEHGDCAIRVGLSKYNTIEEVDYFVDKLKHIVSQIRK